MQSKGMPRAAPFSLRLPVRVRDRVEALARRLEALDDAPWSASRIILAAVRRGLPLIEAAAVKRERE